MTCFSDKLSFTLYSPGEKLYRSIQIDYRQRFFWEEFISDYGYRIALPEGLISITETDLWEFRQKISHYRYRLSLKFQLFLHYRYRFRERINSVIISAATVCALPHFLARRDFSGEGEGRGAYSEAPCGRNFVPPPALFETPPTPRKVFSRVGAWGCIEFGPVIVSRSLRQVRLQLDMFLTTVLLVLLKAQLGEPLAGFLFFSSLFHILSMFFSSFAFLREQNWHLREQSWHLSSQIGT